MVALASLPRNETGIATAIDILAQRLGPRLQTGEAIRTQHANSATWLPAQAADAVAYLQTADEAADLIRICADHRVPVIPFGTGTSLEGHINAPAGGICADLSGMDQVLEINAQDGDCRVQPGVTRTRLNEELRATGLFFPIDPGADASLGGMASTRASGTNAVRYGTMRDAVLALQVVLPDGRLVRTGTRARKSSAGYDLTRLMVGAEGTLGLITELTLRLHGIPEAIRAAACTFPDVGAAVETCIAVIQSGIPIARIELLDALQVRACNLHSGLDLPEAPLLLLEFHGSPAGVAEQVETVAALVREAGGSGFRWEERAEDRTRLWQARHDAYWAACALRPGAKGLSTDVCVPISNLGPAIEAAQRKAREMNLLAPALGHVGDGNFHVLLLVDPEDAAERAGADAYIEWLAELAWSLDGTCTGEHGIGQGKRALLRREAGEAVDVMAAIKAALDPLGIMNPGKIV
ncbi:FAD-binding oxidoreductase [Jannaschia aquimarina]|uniref:D-lactate dehydrogenase (cytochrome) n=1 Tax=Jannaschia aquimarina TaxID=935700 RepID=A0A0D1EC91_9RHOB|nr:FAD-linked oxidase C-terminal domain-containing protein [Jannaschia aquimarina]KIT15309.1 putative FAD-linked oxidoreductase [Jannaschia aquimarina]SNS50942.1 D-lactate dehydrogenase (cytochrome) [Jannaschia aquimarina]